MNNTKWNEIFHAFFDLECSDDPAEAALDIPWTTKTRDGFCYSDHTWSHFGCEPTDYQEIAWLKITLTPQNRATVLDVLRRIHVPGEVMANCVYVYGYRTDVDYI